MSTTLTSPGAVIDALGGTSKVAAITGRTLQAVSNWRKASNLPRETYLVLTRRLRDRGLEAPADLWAMTVEPRSAPSTVEAL